jgi:dihydrolipoamide dehydrogenase
VVDKLLFAVGSEPDSARLGWERAGVDKGVHGIPIFNSQTLQIPGTNIFMAGDADGHQAHPHQAADAGRVAGYNATHRLHISLREKPDMCIVSSDPCVAWVGARWREQEPVSSASVKIRFRAVGSTAGVGKGPVVLKLYADRRSASLLGGTMIGPGCEDLATLLAGCVQQRLTVGQALYQLDRQAVFGKALQAGLMALQSQLVPTPSAAGALAGRSMIVQEETGFATV